MKRKLSLLLVFTLLLFSSFYFIVPISGATTDSQEESFISSPLPLWSDESSGVDISHDANLQTVLIDHEDDNKLHEDSILNFTETLSDDVLFFSDTYHNITPHVATSGEDDYINSLEKDYTYWLASTTGESCNFEYNYLIDGFDYAFYGHSISGTAYLKVYDGTSLIILETISSATLSWYNGTYYGDSTSQQCMTLHIKGSGATQNFRCDYLEITPYYMTLADDNHFANGFTDVNEWVVDGEGGETFTSDEDIGTFTVEGDGAGDTDFIVNQDISLSVETWDYMEIYYKMSSTVALDVRMYLLDEDSPTYTGIGRISFVLQEYTSWTSVKLHKDNYASMLDSFNGNVETIMIRVRCDLDVDVEMEIDLLQLASNDETGWQHDGSNTYSVETGANMKVTSDGDKLNFSSTANAQACYVYMDYTDTKAVMSYSYYQFLEVSISDVVDGDSDGDVWYLRVYDKDDSYYLISDGYRADEGIFRWNIKATGIDDLYRLRWYLHEPQDSFMVDYMKVYSIADWNYYSGTNVVTDVCYVDSNELVFDKTSADYVTWTYDLPLSVDTLIYSILNITTGTWTGGGAYSYGTDYDVGAGWYGYTTDESRYSLSSGTLNAFRMIVRDSGIIGAIKFIQSGNLDLQIPVEKYKNLKLETMIDTDNITSDLSMRFKGAQESNFMITYKNSTSTLYFDGQTLDVSDYNLLRFTFELKYALNKYSVKVENNESTTLFTFEKYTGVYKINSFFVFNSTAFTNSYFNIYYISGDLDYRTDWLRDTDNEDSNVHQTDFSMSSFSEEDTLHSSERSLFVSGFQFWRSELGLYLYYEGYNKGIHNDILVAGHEITFQFYYPNGTELYRVVFFVNATGETQPIYVEYHTDVLVYLHNELIWSCPRATYNRVPIDLYDGQMRLDSKIALWRTQENSLAVKVNGDMNYYINGEGKDNFTYWQSDISLENYQCNISLSYEIETEGLNVFNVDIIHSYAEYSYDTLDGCVEPHFSTTWWEDIPIINAIINGFIWVGNMIITGLGAIFSGVIAGAISLLSPLLTGITNAVGAVAGAVWALFSGAIAGVTGAVNAVAGGIWALFSATLGAISSGIGDIVSGMTGWVSDAIEATLIFVLEEGLGTLLGGLIDSLVSVMITIVDSLGGVFGIANLGTSIGSFFSMFSSTIGAFLAGFGLIISYAVNAITMIVTYAALFAPSGTALLGIFIIIDITDALLDNKLYKLEKYLNFFQWSLEIMFKIVNAFVQFIGGVIP